MERLPLELLHFFFVVEIELHRVAETSSHASTSGVGDSQYVNFPVQLALLFVEFYRLRRDLHGDVDTRHVRGRVEEGNLHCGGNATGLCCRGSRLQLLLDRIARQDVTRLCVAVSRAGADGSSAAIHLDMQNMTTAFNGSRGRVSEQIVLVLFLTNLV